jgi:hypothetical protein
MLFSSLKCCGTVMIGECMHCWADSISSIVRQHRITAAHDTKKKLESSTTYRSIPYDNSTMQSTPEREWCNRMWTYCNTT